MLVLKLARWSEAELGPGYKPPRPSITWWTGAKFNIRLRSSSGDTNEKGNNDIVVKYKASKGMT